MTPTTPEGSGWGNRGAGTSARRVALDVLRAVQADDAYANLLLPVRIRRAGLSARDAGFATELTYGTIRMIGTYDAIIEAASGRQVANIEADVLDVLRLGVHQLVGMRVPSHAAVSQTVDLTRAIGARRASGFVNAVLRKVGGRGADGWDAEITRGLTGDDLLARRWSHPRWVVGALRDALAAERARDELVALLAADNVPAGVTLAALPGLVEPGDVLPDAEAEPPVSPVGVRGVAGDPSRVPAVADGRARVQDEGSQLAALALTRSSAIAPGERWLDLCAGPGGKAALLAAEARVAGATLVANELVPARAGLVRSALERFTDTVTVTEGDGRRFGRPGEAGPTAPGGYDRVLLDAPCTGLGALRRRPEARWRKDPEDVSELAVVQAELLDAAVASLAPGGTLAYVTCSPHLAETRGQVDALLARHGDVLEQLDTASVVRSIAARDPQVADGATVQLWPHRIGTDAMFIALLRRR
ncbi:transcription antitermination factor NusB [Curtobacterium sp. MCBD17_003]|uniref:RsmB/NOP family class I SAM-dependent RNA methyltransferase n=1 Tax=Curtobacterium sp. MCBD17_003 TaxID=2175667 RepID=UPI0021AD335F|nr:transcription antitermination factor NusB [Curtobacterium sp. MCBD17_003]WIE53283.1 transcription antitermination factor NusB [Curtobacterium sp. MCBD17_003]